MRTLVLDPVGGIAGDMLIAALLDLGGNLDPDALGRLGLRFSTMVSKHQVNGIVATHFDVGTATDPHAHRPYREVREIVEQARLPAKAAQLALGAFALLAKAEGKVHGIAPEEVEFHEVGAVDSIVDVVGSALLVASLAPDRIVALPPPAGSGTVQSAHGIIPVPGPATLEILKGRRLRPSGPGERTTPTGAAMLAAWTEEVQAIPELTVQAIGYGAGTKRWDDAPNVLRAVLGEATASAKGEAAWVLEANLDDLSPQLAAVALEAAIEAGAHDAWIAPLTMKKGRPGHLFGVLCSDEGRANVEAAIFRETSTLGLRATRVERSILDREITEVETRYGAIRVKTGRLDGRLLNAAPEFDDCRQAAERHGVAVKEVLQAALTAFRQR
ncbi:MAG: nickel pincer cofactor biosynthesis protein LarC [Myxococcales bacterium]